MKCYLVTRTVNVKEGKARFGITMDPELVKRIDETRGKTPRATYIEQSLRKSFEQEDIRKQETKFLEDLLNALPRRTSLPKEITEKDYYEILLKIETVYAKIMERKALLSR
jgi:metal-responsive CopG/Arc/MetJ family transcriptional regulator